MDIAVVRLEDFVSRSVLDKVFLGYYLFQILSTLGLDMQGTLPAFLYHPWVRSVHTHHLETWRDPWLANTWPHPWYFSICMWEYFVHVPFYFLAAHAYYTRVCGGDRCSWVRIPLIMYCTQTITAVSGIMFMALFQDFSHYQPDVLVPSGIYQRVKLAGMYGTFLLMCLFNLWDALTARDFLQAPQPQPSTPAEGGKVQQEQQRPHQQ